MSASDSDGDTRADATMSSLPPPQAGDDGMHIAAHDSQLHREEQEDFPLDENEEVLSQARRFLAKEEVRQGSREKKTEFLRSKGLSVNTIETLLAEEEGDTSSENSTAIATPPSSSSSSTITESDSSNDSISTASFSSPLANLSQAPSMPPIVTYPEFLTTSQKPAPLVTLPRLVKGLYAAASTSLLAYGASRFVVSPMVSSLASARLDLTATADAKVSALVNKLEGVVSVVPPHPFSSSQSIARKSNRRQFGLDDEENSDSDLDDLSSEASDPTELFHRDIGVQTSSSLPSSPRAAPVTNNSTSLPSLLGAAEKNPSVAQADRLNRLTQSLRGLESSLDDQRDSADQFGTIVTLLNEDLDRIAVEGSAVHLPPLSYTSGYRSTSAREIDDEIKNARDGIRRLKGVLLSARSFPPAGATAIASSGG